MFFLSFPPKIFPYCKKIALFSKQLGWATHFHQHKFCVLFSTKLQPIDELHFPLFLFIFLSYLTPKVSGLSKHSDISPSLESFLYSPLSFLCHFLSSYSLGMTIKLNENSQLSWFLTVKCLQKTRWGTLCNLVPHPNSGLSLLPRHWVGLQMLHFILYFLCDFST